MRNRVLLPMGFALVGLFSILVPALATAALCSTNCLLVNDATDASNLSCDFGGVGTCSLRDAVTKSSAIQGWSIQFAIGSGHQKITLSTNLPDIITRGTIDGPTQPGFAGAPLIEISRDVAGTATHGLRVAADGLVTVRGLIVNHFDCSNCYAIGFDSPGSNFVEGCYIGTDASGTAIAANGTGIRLNTGVGGNTIGGTSPDKRNVISGNATAIQINNTNDNLIQGNYIGTDVSGTVAIPNGTGVAIVGPGTGNLVGGNFPAMRNVFAGVQGVSTNAVTLTQGGSNVVKGNYIGTDATGLVSMPFSVGVALTAETNDVVANNVISTFSHGITLGQVFGIPTTGTTIQGNYIGTDATGNQLLPLQGRANGIWLGGGARSNLIGGAGTGQGNVIGGYQYGVQVNDTSNSLFGNLIGIGAGGSQIPNTDAGVMTAGGGSTVIGGVDVGEANTIAFNGQGTSPRQIAPGVWIQSGTANVIRGNSIFGNTGKGIEFYFPASTLPYPNDPGDADAGPNNLQNHPVITGVFMTPTSIRIQGTLNSRPLHSYLMDFYALLPPAGATDALQGSAFIGVAGAPIPTDAGGDATFDVTIPVATVPNLWVTATMIDTGGCPLAPNIYCGNTSEFTPAVAGISLTPTLQSAASRRTHGAAGTFNLPLSLVTANPTTEPRQGPAQTIVFTFDKPITGANATVTEGTATASTPTFSGNDVIISLTDVINQQYVTIALTNVASIDGGTSGTASVRIGFLLGDVNQNRAVSLSDLGQVNAQIAQLVTATNYLKDVNVNGTLSLADKGITNAQITKALPPP